MKLAEEAVPICPLAFHQVVKLGLILLLLQRKPWPWSPSVCPTYLAPVSAFEVPSILLQGQWEKTGEPTP